MLIIRPPQIGNWDESLKTWSNNKYMYYNMYYDVYIRFKNEYKKTIKYIIFSLVAFDRVNEPLNCNYNNQIKKIKYTGPLYQNEITDKIWKGVFFDNNNDIAYVKVVKIKIVFMNETKTKIDEFYIQIDENL